MATATHGKNAQVWVSDSGNTTRDLTSYARSVKLSRTADVAEGSTFGGFDKVYVGGMRDATLSIEGIHDITVDGYIEGLLGGTARAWKFFPEGSVTGNVVYSGSAALTSYDPSSELGDVVGWTADFQCSGSITRGTV